MATRELKDFNSINGHLYFRGNDGVLAPTVSKVENKEELQCIHGLSCGDNDISLYRHLYGKAYY